MTVWGTGDPILRWLRVLAVLASIGLFVSLIGALILDPTRDDNLPLDALLAGVVLLQLGYQVFIPGLSRRVQDNQDDKARTDEPV